MLKHVGFGVAEPMYHVSPFSFTQFCGFVQCPPRRRDTRCQPLHYGFLVLAERNRPG